MMDVDKKVVVEKSIANVLSTVNNLDKLIKMEKDVNFKSELARLRDELVKLLKRLIHESSPILR